MKESWLEITTRNGLKFEVPGTINMVHGILDLQPLPLLSRTIHYTRSSASGEIFMVDLGEYVHMRQFTKFIQEGDPE